MKFMNLEKVNREKDLYGSYARGTPHKRSDIDLAVFIRARDEREETDIIDKTLCLSNDRFPS